MIATTPGARFLGFLMVGIAACGGGSDASTGATGTGGDAASTADNGAGGASGATTSSGAGGAGTGGAVASGSGGGSVVGGPDPAFLPAATGPCPEFTKGK